jgi:6-pyruvoyltetrahydropterin/6-carboxytetrahydropterin synthase
MWVLEKKFTFEAAHKLPNHDGKCARLHGHSWVGVVRVVGTALKKVGPKSGMVMDYASIKSVLQPIIDEYLDHRYLNETLGKDADIENPTSEEIARWLYEKLWGIIPGVESVTIEETCTSSCTYIGTEGGR